MMGARGRRIALRTGLVMAALGLAGLSAYLWLTHEDPDQPVSAESGREYFRHRDFGSPYETGIPYALALAGVKRYPEELGGDRVAFCEKFGTLLDPDDPEGMPIGFVRHHDRLSGTDFLMTNCSLCHTSVVEGRRVDGLGNRNLRLNAMNNAIMRVAARPDFTAESMLRECETVARERGIPWGMRASYVTTKAIQALKNLASKSSADAWGGVNGVDAGPGRNTPVEFAKGASHVPVEPPYGLAKIPAVWTYGYRSSFGYDGSLHGDMAYVLAAVEFNKNMPAAHILRRKARWQSVYEYLKTLQSPAYPRAIDADLSARGRSLFAANCAHCHGTYKPGERAKYREKVVPLAEVGTDPDRLGVISDALLEARSKGDFAKVVHLVRTDGYVPPPLLGVWCRGPYLHNGSVPTLSDLLRPVEERPVSFHNGGDTAYDLDRVGLAYDEETTSEGRRAGRRRSPKQFQFQTKDPGNGNGGHEFGVDLPIEDRRALLEYLKTL